MLTHQATFIKNQFMKKPLLYNLLHQQKVLLPISFLAVSKKFDSFKECKYCNIMYKILRKTVHVIFKKERKKKNIKKINIL